MAAAPPPFADGQGKEAIRRAIEAITPAVRDCYEQGLRMQPELEGRLVLQLAIEAREAEGRIVEAAVDEEGTTLDAILVQACALDALSDATFPQPHDHGIVSVRYPFVFSRR